MAQSELPAAPAIPNGVIRKGDPIAYWLMDMRNARKAEDVERVEELLEAKITPAYSTLPHTADPLPTRTHIDTQGDIILSVLNIARFHGFEEFDPSAVAKLTYAMANYMESLCKNIRHNHYDIREETGQSNYLYAGAYTLLHQWKHTLKPERGLRGVLRWYDKTVRQPAMHAELEARDWLQLQHFRRSQQQQELQLGLQLGLGDQPVSAEVSPPAAITEANGESKPDKAADEVIEEGVASSLEGTVLLELIDKGSDEEEESGEDEDEDKLQAYDELLFGEQYQDLEKEEEEAENEVDVEGVEEVGKLQCQFGSDTLSSEDMQLVAGFDNELEGGDEDEYEDDDDEELFDDEECLDDEEVPCDFIAEGWEKQQYLRLRWKEHKIKEKMARWQAAAPINTINMGGNIVEEEMDLDEEEFEDDDDDDDDEYEEEEGFEEDEEMRRVLLRQNEGARGRVRHSVTPAPPGSPIVRPAKRSLEEPDYPTAEVRVKRPPTAPSSRRRRQEPDELTEDEADDEYDDDDEGEEGEEEENEGRDEETEDDEEMEEEEEEEKPMDDEERELANRLPPKVDPDEEEYSA